MARAASRSGLAVVLLVALLLGARLWLAASPAQAANPSALWRIVHNLCVPDARLSGSPAPCLAVDLHRRFAVLKDIRGKTQVLLVPTDRLSGIDAPPLLRAGGTNYWQAAWEARAFVERRAGRPVPRPDLALAINSAWARSQNQLHIHVDCIKPEVRDTLAEHAERIGLGWRPLAFTLVGHRYLARRIMGEDIAPNDPFKLLAAGDRRAGGDMAREGLAVIPMQFRGGPGFVLLADRVDMWRADKAAGEDVIDHDCKVLQEDRP